MYCSLVMIVVFVIYIFDNEQHGTALNVSDEKSKVVCNSEHEDAGRMNGRQGGELLDVVDCLKSGLYWVATHFPQWAGVFLLKKMGFKKNCFYKKIIIEKYLKKLKITFNLKFNFFIIRLYFQLISYLIRDGLYICCLSLFQVLLIFISF